MALEDNVRTGGPLLWSRQQADRAGAHLLVTQCFNVHGQLARPPASRSSTTFRPRRSLQPANMTNQMIRIVRAVTMAGLITSAACQAIPATSSQIYALPRCAQPQPVSDRSYRVFFDQHSAVITPRGLTTIQAFSREFSIYSDLDVFIEASVDTSEVSARDRGLDLRRGRAVAHLIKQLGIASDSRVHIIGAGTTSFLVPTPPQTPEPQNRSATLFTRGGKQMRPTALQSECLSWLREHRCGPGVSDAQQAICLKVEGVTDGFGP